VCAHVPLPSCCQVRGELAPWEAQMAEVQSHIDVATSERDLLLKQQQDAKGERQALSCSFCSTTLHSTTPQCSRAQALTTGLSG